MGRIIGDDVARFWSKVERRGPDECWLWIGPTSGRGAVRYGIFSRNSRNMLAHRWSYEHHVGPIPDGLVVCHRCDVPACVNPRHLFAATQGDNIRDARDKGRHVSPQAGMTHCRQGHEFTPENTYVHPTSGFRTCRTCARASYRRYRARRRT